MKSISALYYGLLLSLLLGFIASVFQSYIYNGTTRIAWSYFISGLFFFFVKYLINKTHENKVLSEIEVILLIVNILIFVIGLGSVLATFSKFGLSDKLRLPGIALGLPNLIAFIYWNKVKNVNPT